MPKGDKLKLKADPDDGTTPVSNLLLEALAIANLNGTEKGLVLYLWRETYGWLVDGKRQKDARIPQEELATRMGTSSRTVYSALKSLTEKHVFLRTELGQGKGYVYRMNTDISTWNSHTVDFQQLKILSGLEENIKGSQFLLPLKKTSTPAQDKPESPSVDGHENTEGGSGVLPLKKTATLPLKKTATPTILKEILKESIKKDIYGEFANVKLTKTEYDKLLVKFGDVKTKEFIERLSAGIASKGYKYSSHYATILNWENMDKKKGAGPGGSNGAHQGHSAASTGHYTEPPGKDLPL